MALCGVLGSRRRGVLRDGTDSIISRGAWLETFRRTPKHSAVKPWAEYVASGCFTGPDGGIVPASAIANPLRLKSERPSVIKRLWNMFYGPEAEAKRLNRDVVYIVHALNEEHYGPIAKDVATDLRKDELSRSKLEAAVEGLLAARAPLELGLVSYRPDPNDSRETGVAYRIVSTAVCEADARAEALD